MVTLIAFLCVAFVVGFLIGKTRSRDALPREVYDKDGRRIL